MNRQRTVSKQAALSWSLIFTLLTQTICFAQEPQTRILVPEGIKASAAKQHGPRDARPQLVLQTGLTEPAAKIAFSPDHALLAALGVSGGSIKLWELATGRELLTLKPRDGASDYYQTSADFVFSPDGASLLSYARGTLRQWETRTGRMLRELSLSGEKEFGSARFSPDGRFMATFGTETGVLKLWDAASGALLQTQQYRQTEKDQDRNVNVNSFAFSPDSRLLAISEDEQDGMSDGSQIVVREVAGWRTVQTIVLQKPVSQKDQTKAMQRGSRDAMEAMIKGKAALSSSIAGLGGLAGGMETKQTTPVRGVRFTPDGRFIALMKRDLTTSFSLNGPADSDYTSEAPTIKIYEVNNGRETVAINPGAAGGKAGAGIEMLLPLSSAFALSSDGKYCLAAGSERSAGLYEAATGRKIASLSGGKSDVLAATLSVDGKLAATAALDGSIRIWEVEHAATTGRAELARTLETSAMSIGGVAFAADGKSLTVAGQEAVNVWELNSGAALRTLARPERKIETAADYANQSRLALLSADGRYFFGGEKDGVKVWEARTGKEVRTLPLPGRQAFNGIALSRDGGTAAITQQFNASAFVKDMLNPTAASQNVDPAQPSGKDDQKKSSGSGIGNLGGLGGLGNLGGLGGLSRSGKASKADLKELKRIDKEMQKKQEEYQKAMERGETGRAMEIGSELATLVQQMQVASGQPPIQMPFPMPQAPAQAKNQGQTTSTNDSTSPGQNSPGSLNRDGIKVFDLSSGRQTLSLKGTGLIDLIPQSTALSPDGKLLASAFNGAAIRLTDATSGKELPGMKLDRGISINALAFSADGRLLASVSLETRQGVNQTQTNLSLGQRYLGTLRIWDVSDPSVGGRELQSLAVNDQIPALVFSSDNRVIAAGSSEVKLFEVGGGRELAKLTGHTMPVSSICFSPDGKLIVTGGEDGSTRLWNAQNGELLASLVSLNKGADWLVVTPDGLFDGTPAGWGQILWRFSENISDVAPVEIFFNEFYYPGLLADIAAGKRPRAAQDVAQKDRRQPSVKLSTASANAAARMLKIKLEISESASSGQNSGPATGPIGARDLRLFRNGTLVKVWRGDLLKGQKQVALEVEIPIVAGENRLTAYAFNRDNVKSADANLIVTGGAGLKRKGVIYALACGVNQYSNTQYNLKYAVADATSFADEVRAQQAKLPDYERVEIIPLLDKDATKANILLALRRLSGGPAAPLPAGAPQILTKLQPAQPEDAVLIFFAGHGTAQGARFYLVPHDLGYAGARNALTPQAVQTILSRSVSDLELEAAIEGVDAGQLLFVLDACNSGQALEAEEKRRGPMNSTGLAQLAYEKGVYILTAAQSYQAALEAAQLGHGYLTFALIEEGLKKGMADRDLKDGQVLAREWFNYATDRVPQMQEKEMQTRLLLDFAENDAKAKDPKQRNLQRPRVFYRREAEARPFIVAKP